MDQDLGRAAPFGFSSVSVPTKEKSSPCTTTLTSFVGWTNIVGAALLIQNPSETNFRAQLCSHADAAVLMPYNFFFFFWNVSAVLTKLTWQLHQFFLVALSTEVFFLHVHQRQPLQLLFSSLRLRSPFACLLTQSASRASPS